MFKYRLKRKERENNWTRENPLERQKYKLHSSLSKNNDYVALHFLDPKLLEGIFFTTRFLWMLRWMEVEKFPRLRETILDSR